MEANCVCLTSIGSLVSAMVVALPIFWTADSEMNSV